MFASVVHLSRKNPMGGVSGGGKILPRFPRLWGAWGRSAVFESCLVEFEVEAILKHRQIRGEDQYLVRWKGYDQSEDMWLNEAQLEHSAQLLEDFRRQH